MGSGASGPLLRFHGRHWWRGLSSEAVLALPKATQRELAVARRLLAEFGRSRLTTRWATAARSACCAPTWTLCAASLRAGQGWTRPCVDVVTGLVSEERSTRRANRSRAGSGSRRKALGGRRWSNPSSRTTCPRQESQRLPEGSSLSGAKLRECSSCSADRAPGTRVSSSVLSRGPTGRSGPSRPTATTAQSLSKPLTFRSSPHVMPPYRLITHPTAGWDDKWRFVCWLAERDVVRLSARSFRPEGVLPSGPCRRHTGALARRPSP